ncbi:MAG: patatin-like phospholipase family protein [Clostridia bacterium]|nr:patatin-like phospholipase family protein [Clostridia bacterium]
MKVGLVLEGGGMRGMYTAGVLDIFMENNIEVDGIVGVSAGVLFGVNYISKQKGRVIRYNKRFVKDKRYMGIGSLIKTGNIVNKEFAYYEVPFKLDIFDEKEFEKSSTEMYATLTNVETGLPEYVKVTNVFKQMEVLRATAAMPFVSKIVEIDGNKYLDGGIADSIPIEKIKQMNFDKIIVVLTRPIEYRKKKANEFAAKCFYKKYPNLVKVINNRYQNYNDSVKKIIDYENKKEIFVIRPSKTINIKRMENDENKLQEMYDLGVKDCKGKLEELKKYLEEEN